MNCRFIIISICICISHALLEENEIKIINYMTKKFNKDVTIISAFNKSDTLNVCTHLWNADNYIHCFYNESLDFTKKEKQLAFVIIADNKDSAKVFDYLDKSHAFVATNKFIIVNHFLFKSDLIKFFNSYEILVDTEFYIMNKLKKNKFEVVELYKKSINDVINLKTYETWNFYMNTTVKNSKGRLSVAQRRRDLLGFTFRNAIVITDNDTLRHLKDYRNTHIDSITKVNYILVEHLANIMNASLYYILTSTWGYKENGSWTGMIGEITNGNADIGGTPLFITANRLSVISYISMTTPTKSRFVWRRPPLSSVANVFVRPLHFRTWIATFTMLVLSTIVLAFALRWEHRCSYSEKTEEIELRERDSLLIALGAVCGQGAHVLPKRISGRIVTWCIFVWVMFVYVSYTANIVALLQAAAPTVHSLEDLLNSPITLGVHDTVYNRVYFPGATEPVRRRIYLQKIAPPNQFPRYYSLEEGISKLRKGMFGFHMECGAGYKIVGETFYEHEKCDLEEMEYLQVPEPWLAIPKSSPYAEIMKIGLRQIQESGIQSREVWRVYTRRPQCHGRASAYVTVGIIDCYFAFAIILCGFFMSLLVLICEYTLHTYVGL